MSSNEEKRLPSFIPEALKIRALNELQRRAGEREASS